MLYWYKSTNTDAAGGAQKQSKTEGVGSLTGSRERERERESRSVGSARRLQGSQFYWLYWCKSTNTDAEGAASLSPLRPAHELGVIDLLANFCGWLELLADLHLAPSEPGTNVQMLTQLVLSQATRLLPVSLVTSQPAKLPPA